jgi:hypothetical protein
MPFHHPLPQDETHKTQSFGGVQDQETFSHNSNPQLQEATIDQRQFHTSSKKQVLVKKWKRLPQPSQ